MSYFERNFKEETISTLHEHGKSDSDVLWVGGEDFTIPVSLFWKLADNEYDSSYGSTQIPMDLVVVGKDFWMERHEYDGSEWWEFKHQPEKPSEERTVQRVISNLWGGSLSQINENPEEEEEEWRKNDPSYS